MRDALEPLVQQKRSGPGNDLISELATAAVEGERLTGPEVVNFLCLLVLAGAETTYRLLGSALLAMLRDPRCSHRCGQTGAGSPPCSRKSCARSRRSRSSAAWRWTTSRSRAPGSRGAVISCSASVPPTATRPLPRPGPVRHRSAGRGTPRVRPRPPLLRGITPRDPRGDRRDQRAARPLRRSPAGPGFEAPAHHGVAFRSPEHLRVRLS